MSELVRPSFWDSYLRPTWSELEVDFSPPHYRPTLLLAEPGNGSQYLALALVAGQACAAPSFGLGCLECSVCSQVLGLAHPDVLVLGLEQSLKLESANSIQEHLQTSTGRRQQGSLPRTVVVYGVERMNDAGVNRLLKIVEEPPEHSWVLMTAGSKESLLDTLVSRLFCIQLRLARAEQVAEENPDLDAFAKSYCGGSYGRVDLWRAFEEQDLWTNLDQIIHGSSLSQRFKASEQVFQKVRGGKAKKTTHLPAWFEQVHFWQALEARIAYRASVSPPTGSGEYKRRALLRGILGQYRECKVPYNFRLALDAVASC